MKEEDIRNITGFQVNEKELADMVRSMPIRSGATDARMRSDVLTFSFGPRGVVLESVEDRGNSVSKKLDQQ